MSGPIHKDRLLVGSFSPQVVPGRPISAGLDPQGVPSVWYVCGGASQVVTVPTGAVPPPGRHVGTFIVSDLVVHVWSDT